MNRSKIFLGITTCFLAIAGVAATKARFTNVTAYYKTAGSNHNCVSKAFNCGKAGSSFTCRTSGATGAIVYTIADCTAGHVLYYGGL